VLTVYTLKSCPSFKNLVSISSSNLQQTDDFLQNQINDLGVTETFHCNLIEGQITNFTTTGNNNFNFIQGEISTINKDLTNLHTEDQLLQNEIDNIVLATSYAGSVDALYGVSIAVIDSYNRVFENNAGVSIAVNN